VVVWGTVFSNTATVESDFSGSKKEKDEHRKSLTDLSLEGAMQANNLIVFLVLSNS